MRPPSPKSATVSATKAPRPDPGAHRLWPLAVALVALAACLSGLGNSWAQDDTRLVLENIRVHGLSHWRDVLTLPYWPPPWHPELYRPVLTLFHALQYTLGGGDPLLFRLVSYALYAATSVAVFLLARKLLPPMLAVAVGLLFAAHPVHVEAVALAVGQSELIVALLTVALTLRYLDRRRRDALRPRDWALFAGCYFLVSMTKEQGLLLPAFLLAGELCLLSGPMTERIGKLWRGYAALALVAGGTILLRRLVLGGQFTGVFVSEALQGLTLPRRALTMLQIVPQWLRLFVWPVHLQADYAPQELVASTHFGAMEAAGLLILLLVLVAAWSARRRAPALTFGVLWLAIALVPVSNVLIPTGFLLAERTLFLPSVGFLIALAGGVGLLFPAGVARRSRGQSELAAVCGALVLLGVVRSAQRHRVWRNEAFFTVRGVQDAPRSYRTQRAYGDVLFALGQKPLALEAYARARALAPVGNVWRVHNDLARNYRVLGETGSEAAELEASLAEAPGQEDTRGYLIAAYLLLGRYVEAAQQADSALARGGKAEVFRSIRALADSAARTGAPPGSIRIRVVPEPTG